MTVERPRQKGHGDYATNVALQLAKKAGMNPRDLAALVQQGLEATDGIAGVDIAGPGFLNITVAAGAQGVVAAQIVDAGAAYGGSDAFAGEKINLEFVSANPTGPIHIGGVRWAAVGDALGRIFDDDRRRRSPASTTSTTTAPRSTGSAARCWPARKGEPAPEDGYGGEYIHEIAAAVVAKAPQVKDLTDDEAQEVFRAEGVEMMFEEIKQSLHDFGVDFDVYFHENNLHRSGAVDRADRAADRARQHLRAGRRAVAAHRAVRRRQGPGDHPVQRRAGATSRATSPTTSTSASAASTAASSCSAPTTTATSAG